MATTDYKKISEMHDKYPLAFGYVDKVLMKAAKANKTMSEADIGLLQSDLKQLALYLQQDGFDLRPGTFENWFSEVEVAYPNWQDSYKIIYMMLAYARGER